MRSDYKRSKHLSEEIAFYSSKFYSSGKSVILVNMHLILADTTPLTFRKNHIYVIKNTKFLLRELYLYEKH